MWQCSVCKKWGVPYKHYHMCKECYDKMEAKEKQATFVQDLVNKVINWCKKCDFTKCDGCTFAKTIKSITGEK